MPLLWGLARIVPGVVCGEIGFKNGSSALAMLIGARESGGRVYSIDIEPCDEGRARVEREGYADIHTFIHGDSKIRNFPEPLDILFIDGDHTYLEVASDYERHRDSVKPGGLIFFHDPQTCPEGVGQFLAERGIAVFPILAGLGLEKR